MIPVFQKMSINPPKRVKYDAWCSTKITQSPTFTSIWSIENYSQISKPLKSDKITIKSLNGVITKWILGLKIYENENEDDEESGSDVDDNEDENYLGKFSKKSVEFSTL